MVVRQQGKPTVVSIEEPISVSKLRLLNPHEPIDELRVSSKGRLFDLKRAQVVSSWSAIRSISIWCTTTRAAFRQLLSVSGLEEVYIIDFHDHGSINGMPKPSSLHTLTSGWLSSDDLMNIAELPGLKTLSAQNSMLSKAVISSLINMRNLTNLDLEATNLDDEMAATLACSKSVTQLDIGATSVGRKGLKSICSMAQLRELDIWALNIQESDLDELSALSNLEYLSIGGYDHQTALTAEGVLPRIALLPSLKRLWLDGITLTKAEVAELEERYEQVRVTFVH